MNTATPKSKLVVELIDALRGRLGGDAFQVIDHWPEDPMAVGIASPRSPGVLAYVSVTPETAEPYFVSLELPTEGEGSEHPYLPGDERNECGIDELVVIIAAHLRKVPPHASGSVQLDID